MVTPQDTMSLDHHLARLLIDPEHVPIAGIVRTVWLSAVVP